MKTRRIVLGVISAAIAMSVTPVAHAGLRDCINQGFWNQTLHECPGMFESCVNSEFWNQNIPSCL